MVSPIPNEVLYDKIQLDPYLKRQRSKLIQVIQNFFTKAVQIISQDNSDHTSGAKDATSNKINKWFNIHMYSSDVMRDDLKLWKLCTDLSVIPPMIIETYLDLRNITSKQIVALQDDSGNVWDVPRGGSKKQEIILERWLVEFEPSEVSGEVLDELPLIYKQAIILFRSLYAFIGLMPTSGLNKLLIKSKSENLIIGNKILDGKHPISSKGRVGLSKPIIPHQLLSADSHLNQKFFHPIVTSTGALKVSVAYRRHSDFFLHDNDESIVAPISLSRRRSSETPQRVSLETERRLSDHGSRNFSGSNRRPSHSSQASTSLSPTSSHPQSVREISPAVAGTIMQSNTPYSASNCSSIGIGAKSVVATPPVVQHRPAIQPFKVSSISGSPPPMVAQPNIASGSLERRISITSNKSTSNASLAAFLRNPRGSTSSTNTTPNIPIANSNNPYNSVFPRSFSSSHGSTQLLEDVFPSSHSAGGTPKFSSSFGSRASRRFSNTSIRHATPTGNVNEVSILGTSADLNTSAAVLSGLYIDDNISDFVKMIDSKSELRFSAFNSGPESTVNSFNPASSSQVDVLSKFQQLKNQHQQIGDSVNASLTLQHHLLVNSNSPPSSQKSSHSAYSPTASFRSGSYENLHLPSIHSRLRQEAGIDDIYHEQQSNEVLASGREDEFIHPVVREVSISAGTEHMKAQASKELIKATVSGTRLGMIDQQNTSSWEHRAYREKSPSFHSEKPAIHYETVFDDDDEDDDEVRDGHNYYLSKEENKGTGPSIPNIKTPIRKDRSSNHSDIDDDLLFTMSDMHFSRH